MQIAAITAGIRKEIFGCEKFKFSGHFPPSSERDCIPYNLKLLISMILYGPTLKSKENIKSQACLTVAQIILHSLAGGSKKLIDQLNELCISISYDGTSVGKYNG